MSKKALTYNEALAEIEAIIERIEGDELDVDELTKDVKRVSELLKICKLKLRNTEEEVQKILREFDEE
ncbi:MAG TPA: exodeoxyribonuclease VII small subunit [Tenuifilaceae bacterium]|jgi:exodeoxyribonuclease VII small subunit|nr:exodeoxyribonuclease VII small subunit [Tenuifilaceae bacterium]HPX04553.1 exodeoxyribonuclease VII small subunit [Tenuifilaceae bacterium]HQB79291.1 exodeoxyribonuclease VII small subunit [Tenuifilaceae bacterium]